MMTLMDELKEYLRIDGEEEDMTLSLFLNAAQKVLSDSGVFIPEDPYEIVKGKDIHSSFRLAVLMLSTHYYENRLVNTPLKVEQAPIPYGIQSIILQLKAR